jgi:hypothetical protein
MSSHDTPTFRHANPQLALTPADGTSFALALKLQSDAADVRAEGNHIQPADRTRQVRGRSAFTENRDFLDAVQIFSDAEALACGEDQNIRVRVSALLLTSAASYCGYRAVSSATVSGLLICIIIALKKVCPAEAHVWA